MRLTLSLLIVLVLSSCSVLNKKARRDSSVVEKPQADSGLVEVVKRSDLDNRRQGEQPKIRATGEIYIRGVEDVQSYLISQSKSSRLYVSHVIISEIDKVAYRKLTLAKSGTKVKARLHKKYKDGRTKVKLTLTLEGKSVTSVFELVKKDSIVDFELGKDFLDYNYILSK